MLQKFLLWLTLSLPLLAWADGLSIGVTVSTGPYSLTTIGATWTPSDTSRSGLRAGFVANDSVCTEVTTVVYTTSSHPSGNRFGLLNEHNRGRGDRCYVDRKRQYYWILAGLTNSQFGPTIAFGPGARYRLLSFSTGLGQFSFDVGGEIPFVRYEYGCIKRLSLSLCRSRVINSPLPMLHAAVSWKYGNVEIGALQLWLPKNAAHLRAMLVQGGVMGQTAPPGFVAAFPPGPSFLPEESRSRPSLFIRYEFTSLLGL